MYHTLIAATLSLSLVSAGALAGTGHYRDGKSKFMAFFDSNNDNIVTIEELNEASKKRFAKMDADGNGEVTHEEFKAYVSQRRKEHRQQRFANIDANNDGQVTKEEYVSYKTQKAERRFQRMDSDSDGLVNAEEFGNYKRGRYGDKHRHHGGKHGHHGGKGFFSKLDKNSDGKITLDESLEAWTNWFKRIDANNDQVVTEEEVRNYRASKMGPR